ncbi:MAG: transporter substrate-binding domain-containing protein [Candidatus Eisenbacteria bacterium]
MTKQCVPFLVVVGVLCAAFIHAADAHERDGPLVIGTELDHPPYSFLDENGEAAGFNVDLTRAIAVAMELDVEVRIGPLREMLQALERGEIDAIAGMFYSPERDKLMDFSPPFATIHHATFIRSGSPTIETEDDLRGKDIIVMRGDIMHDYVLEHRLSDSPVLVDTPGEALQQLASGKHDCALVARLQGLHQVRVLELSNIEVVGPALHQSDYSYAVIDGDAELLGHLSEGLAVVGETGTHKNIHDKWLGVLEPRGVPLSVAWRFIAYTAVPLLLLLASVVVWSRSLKRQVKRRTRALQESEQRLARINQVLAAVRKVDQLITHEMDRDRLLDGACRLLVETPGFARAWIALVEGSEVVGPIFHAGFDRGFAPLEVHVRSGHLPNCGVRALGQGGVHVMENTLDQCNDCPMAPESADGTAMSVRLESASQAYGWLTLYIPPEYARNPEEQSLLAEVAGDLASALRGIEDAGALSFATDIVDSSSAVAFVWENAEGWPVLYASENAERIFGFAARDFVSGAVPYADVVHPDDMERVTREVTSSSADRTANTVAHTPYRIVTRDGNVRWVDDMTTIQRAKDGRVETYRGILLDITGRRLAEEALRRSQERYLGVFESTSSGVAVYEAVDDGEDFVFRDLNTRGEQIDGVARKDLIGKRVTEVFPGVVQFGLLDVFRRVWRVGKPECYPIKRYEDARIKGWRENYIYRLSSGEIVAVYEDATNRKLSEQSLRESEERYRLLADNATDNIWIVRLSDMRVTYTSPAVKALLGYSPEEMLELEISDYVPAESMGAVTAAVHEALGRWDPSGADAGAVRVLELELLHKNGKRVWVEMSARLLVDDVGWPDRILGISRDIAERKQADEERKRLVHAQGKRIKELHCLNGLAKAIRRPESLENVLQITVELMSTAWQYPEISRARITYDGKEFVSEPFEEPSWRLSSEFLAGDKRGIVDMFYLEEQPEEDEGPFLKEERDLLDSIARLLGEVAEGEQTRDEKAHVEEQYRQGQRMESIGRLAGGIAHDLNNLLTPILGYGEMLQEKLGLGDVRREFVDEIIRAGLGARDLVQHLLAFSRKQTLEYKTLDLSDTVAGFEKLLRSSIREDIEIKTILSPDVKTIQADVGQIEQVIMNLAVNAQDATSGSGTLTIETSAADLREGCVAKHHDVTPGEYAILAVSDTGCGMDDETLKQVFEPFFSTKGDKGTGLGLATVYGIVKQHGGHIWVCSEPGKGTIFRIGLPVSRETSAGKTPVKREIGEVTAADPGGSETILLAEDNEQLRVLARTLLERLGYTVLLAADGETALTVMGQHEGTVDLLLTDVVMPGMNGRELFARSAEKYPGLKVLYMSGYPRDVLTHEDILDEGITTFVRKPFSIHTLAVNVREALEQVEGIGLDGASADQHATASSRDGVL